MSKLDDELSALQRLWTDNLPDTPPGMTGEDVPLWQAWAAEPMVKVHGYYFNVRVGPFYESLAASADPADRVLAANLAARIDALAPSDEAYWILEFHRTAGLAQYGRALAYPKLLRTTYGVDVPLRAAVIVYTVNPYFQPLYTAAGIPLFRYENVGDSGELVNPEALLVPPPPP